MRRLVTCQPSAVENYLSRSEDLFNQHRIKEKIERLKETWDKRSLANRATEYNKIDKQATKLLISLEKKCYKLRTGAVPFNLELSKLGLKWWFW